MLLFFDLGFKDIFKTYTQDKMMKQMASTVAFSVMSEIELGTHTHTQFWVSAVPPKLRDPTEDLERITGTSWQTRVLLNVTFAS